MHKNTNHHPTTEIGAILDAAEQLASDLTKGETILAKLPPNATHGQLRALIVEDQAKLMADAGL